jgi:hypothetical protein
VGGGGGGRRWCAVSRAAARKGGDAWRHRAREQPLTLRPTSMASLRLAASRRPPRRLSLFVNLAERPSKAGRAASTSASERRAVAYSTRKNSANPTSPVLSACWPPPPSSRRPMATAASDVPRPSTDDACSVTGAVGICSTACVNGEGEGRGWWVGDGGRGASTQQEDRPAAARAPSRRTDRQRLGHPAGKRTGSGAGIQKRRRPATRRGA